MKAKAEAASLPLICMAGIEFAASSQTAAASIDTSAISRAAKAASIVHQVPCRMRRYSNWRGLCNVRRCR